MELYDVLKKLSVINYDDGNRFTEPYRLNNITALLWNTKYRRVNFDGLFNMYAPQPMKYYGEKGVIVVSTHVDCCPGITKCFTRICEDGLIRGTYDNSITNASILYLMMRHKLPDDVIVAFTGGEENESQGANDVVSFLRKNNIRPRHIYVLDVTDRGYDERVCFTIENNFWVEEFGAQIVESARQISQFVGYTWAFVPSDVNVIPSYVPKECVISAEAERDESWKYDEKAVSCNSICLPVSGLMHDNGGVLVRQDDFVRYTEALNVILKTKLDSEYRANQHRSGIGH